MPGRGGRGTRGGRGGHADPNVQGDAKWTRAPGAAAAPLSAEEQREAARAAMSAAPELPGTAAPRTVEKKSKEQIQAEAAAKPAPKPGGKKAAAPPATAASEAAAPDEQQQGMSREGTANSGAGRRGGRRGRTTEAASGGLEISNRNRQPRKDRPARDGADAKEDGAAAAAANDEGVVDDSKFTFTMPEGAGEFKFRMKPVHHGRVKIQTNSHTLGKYKFLIKERSVPGQDDAVYEKHPDVWEAVPRGHCVASVCTGQDQYTPVGEMLGMRKFGYRDAKYGNRAEVRTVVAIEKENGECAHLSAFTHDKVRFWMSGSKHVTIIFRDDNAKEDIDSFLGKPRTKMACRVAHMAADTLARLSKENRIGFHEALAAPGWTANAEVIFADSQHIVDYNEVNDLRFYAITGPGSAEQFGLCALGPDQSRDLLEKYGLHAVKRLPRVLYKSEAYKEQVNEIARRENSEGSVMYGEDAQGRVVCMWKEKSYPYVMERIVREAIKGQKIGAELVDYVQYRLGKMEKELRHYFASWERDRLPFLVEFAAWLREINAFKGKDVWDVSSQWLSLQRKCKEVDPAKRKSLVQKYQGQKQATSEVSPIMLAGPPGSGKSTIARALFCLLQKAGQVPRWLNQDEAGGDRKKFLAGLERALRDTTVTHVILDKSNLAAANRKDYQELHLTPIVTLVLNHPEGPDELAKMCIDRVCNRGLSHRSLRIDEKNQEKTVKIIKDFVANADWPDDPSCVELDARKPLVELLRDAYNAVAHNNPKPLPDFDQANAEAALSIANDYERLLSRFAGTNQLFASLKVMNADELRGFIPQGVLPKKLIVKDGELHMTVKYFGGEIDPVVFVNHARKVGSPVELTIGDLVYDDRGACMTVSGKVESANANPHITIANAQGTPPVYSNELLAKPANLRKRVAINKKITAVYAFQ